jgi:hypothetical protein
MAKTGSEKKQPLNAAQRGDKRRENFVRVVTPRVTKAIKAIGLIANCAGSNYLYTEAQAAQIVGALDIAVGNIREAFSTKVVAASGFSFKD